MERAPGPMCVMVIVWGKGQLRWLAAVPLAFEDMLASNLDLFRGMSYQ